MNSNARPLDDENVPPQTRATRPATRRDATRRDARESIAPPTVRDANPPTLRARRFARGYLVQRGCPIRSDAGQRVSLPIGRVDYGHTVGVIFCFFSDTRVTVSAVTRPVFAMCRFAPNVAAMGGVPRVVMETERDGCVYEFLCRNVWFVLVTVWSRLVARAGDGRPTAGRQTTTDRRTAMTTTTTTTTAAAAVSCVTISAGSRVG